MKLAFFLIVSLCFLNISSMMPDSTGPFVTIPALGQVRGSYLTSVNGRQFLAFRGIPYAKPPVGNLRFEDPVAANPWQGEILNATKEGSKCLQHNFLAKIPVEGEEDCLHLNIYTHSSKPEGGLLKPVMVYIHGGIFRQGSGNGENDRHGPGHIMDRDVVLVTLNYRLAAFGFFSTGDAEAPGNYGLLDQSLALRWVREHIGNFGGDPASVTIFGNSAGGASVEYHILSPHSKGLFDRAIAQSGSVFCGWGKPMNFDEVVHFSQILAEYLNCPSNSTREMVNCLRYKDAKEISEIYSKKELVMGLYTTVKFGPRVDKERQKPFLPDEPKTLIQEKRFQSVPIIMGLTQNEASFKVAYLVGMNEGRGMKELKEDPEKYLPFILEIGDMNDGKAIAKAASKNYFGDEPDYENQLTQLEHMISDNVFNKPVYDSANLFSQYSDHPVYFYYYTHQGQFSIDSLLGAPPGFNQGVSHVSELFLMFAQGKLPLISTPGDIKVSKLMIDLWTSFAKNGIPKSHLVKGDWVPLVPKVLSNYLRIEAENPEMVVNQSIPFHHRLTFWDQIFDTNHTIKNKE